MIIAHRYCQTQHAPETRSAGDASAWTRSAARLAVIGLLGLLSVGAAGCVVNDSEGPPRGVVVNGPPPPPVRESPPPPPGPQASWVQGYWHWTGMQYAWIPGHWEAPPPGATWNAPVYSNRDGRYFYDAGGWRTGPAGQTGPARNANAIR